RCRRSLFTASDTASGPSPPASAPPDHTGARYLVSAELGRSSDSQDSHRGVASAHRTPCPARGVDSAPVLQDVQGPSKLLERFTNGFTHQTPGPKIGRASCRERVESKAVDERVI